MTASGPGDPTGIAEGERVTRDAVNQATAIEASAPSARAAPARRTPRGIVSLVLTRYGLLVAFGTMIVVFSLARSDAFPTWQNAESILTNAMVPLILAVGLTVPLVMQDFDLSFGNMVGLSSGAAVILMHSHGVSPAVALPAALGLGLATGFVNGFLVSFLGGDSFIITLAMGTVLLGVEYAITNQNGVFFSLEDIPSSFAALGQDEAFLGLNNQVWIGLGILLVVWVLLEKSEIGRYMYAIGGNPEAARLSGVRTREIRLLGFVIIALCGAVAGILVSSVSASYTTLIGPPLLLPAFAGVFLGSAVFRPGEFNVLGTAVGVLFLGTVETGLKMVTQETFVINLVQGGILVAAVLLSRLGRRAA
jgi:ribose transport system permease protein